MAWTAVAEVFMRQSALVRVSSNTLSGERPSTAERLHLAAGDTVFAVETGRGILLLPDDPLTEEALAIAARVSGTYRNALRELAK